MGTTAAIGLGASAVQGIIGGIQATTSGAKKRKREFEAFSKISPVLPVNKQIDSYYSESMRRYQQSPYQTSKFIMGKNLADRSQSTGLAALNKRGMALAGVQNLTARNIDNTNTLFVQGEQDRRQDFGTLGAATRMKAQDEMTQFDINQMTPYNRQLALKQMKAQAANDRKNAGLQMVGSALGNAAMLGMSMPNTPKTPPSTWKSLGSNNQGVSAGQWLSEDPEFSSWALKTNAPTSFSGRALNPQMARTGYGVMQSDRKQPFVMPKIR